MATIKKIDLDKKVETIYGHPVASLEDPKKKSNYKETILLLLSNSNSKGANLIKSWSLAQKILKKKGVMEFNDEEFGLIRQTVEANYGGPAERGSQEPRPLFLPFVIAQILTYLEEQYR